MTLRHPPGRAGRLWLHDRLDVARHGVELLERKRDVLLRERRRLSALADRTGAEWARRCGEVVAPTRQLTLSGGRDALERVASRTERSQAEVEWESAMGVSYPGRIRVRLGDPVDATGPAALGAAIQVHRAALEAAVQHAAASAALARIDAELAGTSQRLRAIRDRLIPRLEDAAQELEIRLDEAEREEIVRSRWVSDDSGPLRTSGGGGR